jgi:hypothetical protein
MHFILRRVLQAPRKMVLCTCARLTRVARTIEHCVRRRAARISFHCFESSLLRRGPGGLRSMSVHGSV